MLTVISLFFHPPVIVLICFCDSQSSLFVCIISGFPNRLFFLTWRILFHSFVVAPSTSGTIRKMPKLKVFPLRKRKTSVLYTILPSSIIPAVPVQQGGSIYADNQRNDSNNRSCCEQILT